MDEKKIKFLQNINNGRIKGSQKLLAKKLKISESTITLWFKENKKPSLDNVIKMAKVFDKTENEIRDIFSITEKTDVVLPKNFVDVKDFELLKEKSKRFELEISLLKRDNELLKKEIENLKEKINNF